MIDIHKLELLEKVANDVVDREILGVLEVVEAIKSMEIILVAIGARHEPVFVEAMNPEGSKPSDDPRSSGHGQAVKPKGSTKPPPEPS